MSESPEIGGESWSELEWDLQDRLRKAMRVADTSVAELADVLGVSRNTVGNYLSGRSMPPRGTLAAWALWCKVPLAWLVGGIPPTGPKPLDMVGVFDARAMGWGGSECAIRDSNPEPAGLGHPGWATRPLAA